MEGSETTAPLAKRPAEEKQGKKSLMKPRKTGNSIKKTKTEKSAPKKASGGSSASIKMFLNPVGS